MTTVTMISVKFTLPSLATRTEVMRSGTEVPAARKVRPITASLEVKVLTGINEVRLLCKRLGSVMIIWIALQFEVTYTRMIDGDLTGRLKIQTFKPSEIHFAKMVKVMIATTLSGTFFEETLLPKFPSETNLFTLFKTIYIMSYYII